MYQFCLLYHFPTDLTPAAICAVGYCLCYICNARETCDDGFCQLHLSSRRMKRTSYPSVVPCLINAGVTNAPQPKSPYQDEVPQVPSTSRSRLSTHHHQLQNCRLRRSNQMLMRCRLQSLKCRCTDRRPLASGVYSRYGPRAIYKHTNLETHVPHSCSAVTDNSLAYRKKQCSSTYNP